MTKGCDVSRMGCLLLLSEHQYCRFNVSLVFRPAMTYLFCLMFTLFKYKVQGLADCRTRGGYVYYCLSFVADTLTVNSRVDKLNLLKTVALG